MQNFINIIEESIQLIGIDPSICRGEKPGQWNLVKGSANVWLDLWSNETTYYFQVVAPVIDLQTVKNTSELFREMLEINHQIFGSAITVLNNYAYIKTVREAAGLDAYEANAMILRVGAYADQYDDYFKQKYAKTSTEPTVSGGQNPPASPPNT